jgi:hypothetical protein
MVTVSRVRRVGGGGKEARALWQERGMRCYGVGIGGERGQLGAQRASGGRVCVQLLFISAVPNTKLCAWGEEDSGGHVL